MLKKIEKSWKKLKKLKKIEKLKKVEKTVILWFFSVNFGDFRSFRGILGGDQHFNEKNK